MSTSLLPLSGSDPCPFFFFYKAHDQWVRPKKASRRSRKHLNNNPPGWGSLKLHLPTYWWCQPLIVLSSTPTRPCLTCHLPIAASRPLPKTTLKVSPFHGCVPSKGHSDGATVFNSYLSVSPPRPYCKSHPLTAVSDLPLPKVSVFYNCVSAPPMGLNVSHSHTHILERVTPFLGCLMLVLFGQNWNLWSCDG